MNPSLATFIYWCGIAGLFYLDRDKAARPSKALWLPVTYFWIIGSRPVSAWLGIAPAGSADVQLNGSPFDAVIFGVLLAAAISVLMRRQSKARILLAANWPILLYFFYCLISVTWSSHPDISFKRWIRSTSDVAMVLIVATDSQPIIALRRLISRLGFVLLPASLLLIKYYPGLGRGYSPDGMVENTGVTTNKNVLGVILLVISLGTLWQVITILRAKGQADRRRHLLAQGLLLALGILLLQMAHSATSIACFMLGGGLILATNLRAFRGRPARVQALCLAVVLAGAFTFLFTGQSDVANTLGRDSNLSGRTEIWAVLIPTVPSSIVGAGFESYWISPSIEIVWKTLLAKGWWHPEVLVTEAHNGYIEVFLNLGWVGVGLISFILISGYRRAIAAIRLNPSVGGLALAYIIAAAVYSITEAGFRSPDPIWIFLLLAIVSATGVTAGFFGESVTRQRASSLISSSLATACTTAYRTGPIG
jgi:exopolysaccharide production protein ExoQ